MASNIASITLPAHKTFQKLNNEELQKLQEDLDQLKHYTENKILEIEIKLNLLFNTSSNIEKINDTNKNININNNFSNNKINKVIPNSKNTEDIKTSFNNIQTNISSKLDFDAMSQLMKKIEEI